MSQISPSSATPTSSGGVDNHGFDAATAGAAAVANGASTGLQPKISLIELSVFSTSGDGRITSLSDAAVFPPPKTPPATTPLPSDDVFRRFVRSSQTGVANFFANHGAIVKTVFYGVLTLLYAAYFLAALIIDAARAAFLIVATVGVVSLLLYEKVLKPIYIGRRRGVPSSNAASTTASSFLSPKLLRLVRLAFRLLLLIVILVLIFVVGGVARDPSKLISALGLIVFVLLFFLFSHNSAAVKWRPVFTGFCLQFFVAILVLKTKIGFCFFEFLGGQVEAFLGYTNAGVEFVFTLEPFVFAFQILPIIIFFSSFVAMLYHTGLMFYVIKKVAWVMAKVMGTTAAESLVAVANIFVSQSEAPLLIRPFLADMTRSEMHAVMTSGMATVAGSTLGAYINFGVKASHLLCASIMSAPAALAMSKLFYPETSVSKTTFADVERMEDKSPYSNILEAASRGASDAIALAAGIAGNLIAFISIVAFVNATLTYLGSLVDASEFLCEPLTLNLIVGYVFIPLAWLMGVSWRDCRLVGELVGLKTIVNEFIAFEKLGKLAKTRVYNQEQLEMHNLLSNVTLEDIRSNASSSANCGSGGASVVNVSVGANLTLSPIFLDYRSEVIATYALCGFANFSSIGIMLGALAAMAPSRSNDLAAVVFRAMITANFACFMTACIAGLLFDESGGGVAGERNCTANWT